MNPRPTPARLLSPALLILALLCCSLVRAGDLYLFGDSLSDTGNNAIATHGGDPAQVVLGNTYVPQLPYASGVYSNGEVWVSSFAAKLRRSDGAYPSLLGGADFAFGGARAGLDRDVPSTITQLGMFLARGIRVRGDDLFVIAVGGNDVRDTLLAASASPGSAQQIIGAAAGSFAAALGSMVDTLQAQGARHILVWNAPDLGLVPAVRALGPQASGTATLIARAFNSALAARLAGERGVQVFDLFATLAHIVAHKSAYGLTNVTDAAGAVPGANPDRYLFWDGIHPTAAGHRVLARHVLNAWREVLEDCDGPGRSNDRGDHGRDRDDRDHRAGRDDRDGRDHRDGRDGRRH